MSLDFELLYPPVIRFAAGCRRELPRVLSCGPFAGSGPVLPVMSATVAASAAGQEVLAGLGARGVAPFIGVPADPPVAVVEAIRGALRDSGAGVVLAVGGGSVIDAAKAAAVLLGSEGPVADYLHGRRALSSPGLPLVALPTTAGTGAEITKNAVLTDPQKGVKTSLRSPLMVPAAALVDPEFTIGMSAALTAASGLDALTQAMESFLSTRAHAVSRPLSLRATACLMEWLPRACREPHEPGVRTRVAEGSLLSAMAFSQSGLGAVHGLAHPLGVALGLAHGTACAVLLPHVLRWNQPACRAEFAELAQAIGVADGEAVIGAVTALCHSLDIPETFAPWGLAARHIPGIAATCRSGSMKGNPRPMSDADVVRFLEELC